jgi:hypothetical protein
MSRKGQGLLTETKLKLMKRNKNRGSRQSVYYGVGEEGECVGIQNKNSRSAPSSLMFLLQDCHILYYLKQEHVLFYIAEK